MMIFEYHKAYIWLINGINYEDRPKKMKMRNFVLLFRVSKKRNSTKESENKLNVNDMANQPAKSILA
jgi:hypothetical protein